MAALKLRREAGGYSLVEVLVGAALLGIVGLIIGNVMTMTSKTTAHTSIQTLIDSLHANGLHLARSPAQIKKILNVDGNTALKECFSRKGSNCTASYQKSWQTMENASGDLNSKFGKDQGRCSTGPNCLVQRRAQYQILCPQSDYCNQVEVKIETSYTGPTTRGNFTKREQIIPIPTAILIGRGKIDFACTGTDRFISSVDYDHLTASCGTLSGTPASPSEQPLRIFPVSSSGDWQALANKSCDNGFGTLGLFSGQPVCTSIGAGGAPSPTPTCAATDMQCQCDIPNNPLCLSNCTDGKDYDLKWVHVQNGECKPCGGIILSPQTTCHNSAYSRTRWMEGPDAVIDEVINQPISGASYYTSAKNYFTLPSCPSGYTLQKIGDVQGVCRSGDCGTSNMRAAFGISKNVTRFKCIKTSCELQPLPPSGCAFPTVYTRQYIYPSKHCGSTAPSAINDGTSPSESLLSAYPRHEGSPNCPTGYRKVPDTTWDSAYSQCNPDKTRLYRPFREQFNCIYEGASAGLCTPVEGPLSVDGFGSCPVPTVSPSPPPPDSFYARISCASTEGSESNCGFNTSLDYAIAKCAIRSGGTATCVKSTAGGDPVLGAVVRFGSSYSTINDIATFCDGAAGSGYFTGALRSSYISFLNTSAYSPIALSKVEGDCSSYITAYETTLGAP